MEIRQATMADLPAIMSIYESARVFMKKHGNSTQWKEGYPGREVIEADIMAGNCYVCEQKERIAGVFSLIIGEDPTYRNIEHGTCIARRYMERFTGLHRMGRPEELRRHVLRFVLKNAVIFALIRMQIICRCRGQF